MDNLERRRIFADKACPHCHGEGMRWKPDPECAKCHGIGSYDDAETGETVECICSDGNPPVACDCSQRERIRVWTEKSKIPEKNRLCRVSTYEPQTVKELEARNAVIAWLDNFYPKASGLYIYGVPGTGKTHLATAICNALIAKKNTLPYYACVTELVEKMISRIGNEAAIQDPLIPCYDAEVLVLDDLGAEKPNEWTTSRFSELIDCRYRQERPTIFTSNLSVSSLEEIYQTRIADRIREHCQILFCDGESRRGKVGARV